MATKCDGCGNEAPGFFVGFRVEILFLETNRSVFEEKHFGKYTANKVLCVRCLKNKTLYDVTDLNCVVKKLNENG